MRPRGGNLWTKGEQSQEVKKNRENGRAFFPPPSSGQLFIDNWKLVFSTVS